MRALCKLAFTQTDCSIYLIPYASAGIYFYGGRTLTEQQVQDTFDFTLQQLSEEVPKLSIHEEGQVHVKVGEKLAGPVLIPALHSLRGQHVASFSADAFSDLPEYPRPVRRTGREIDHVVPVEHGVKSGRLCLFVNGAEPVFDRCDCRLIVTLQRPRRKPLYVGVAPRGQEPMGTDLPTRGCTVVAGWDPTRPVGATLDYIYLRGQ